MSRRKLPPGAGFAPCVIVSVAMWVLILWGVM